MDHAPALLSTPGVATALISGREGDAARRLLLFVALVEQARLNMEGRGWRAMTPPLYLFAHALGIPWTLARALRLARSA